MWALAEYKFSAILRIAEDGHPGVASSSEGLSRRVCLHYSDKVVLSISPA
jgi:hypothetical protein